MRKYLVVNDERNYPELLEVFGAQRLLIRDTELSRGRFHQRAVVRVIRQVVTCSRFFPVIFSGSDPCVFICQSWHYSALIAAKIARFLGKKVYVYLFNFFVNPATRRGPLHWLYRSLLDRHVGVYVNSPDEVAYYNALNPSIAVSYYPFCLGKIEGVDPDASPASDRVFSGGHTNRDYDLLLEAAEELPRTRFLLACSVATILPPRIPFNVSIVKDTPPEEFHRMMATSRMVVVPLASDLGSSGQMVALAAMQFGKIVVYADYPCLSQYFEDDVTGIRYAPGDRSSLIRAITKALECSRSSSPIGSRARQVVQERYSWDAYERKLIENAGEFIQRIA